MYDTRRGGSLFEQDSIVHALIDADSGNPEPPGPFWQTVGVQYYDTNVQVRLSHAPIVPLWL